MIFVVRLSESRHYIWGTTCWPLSVQLTSAAVKKLLSSIATLEWRKQTLALFIKLDRLRKWEGNLDEQIILWWDLGFAHWDDACRHSFIQFKIIHKLHLSSSRLAIFIHKSMGIQAPTKQWGFWNNYDVVWAFIIVAFSSVLHGLGCVLNLWYYDFTNL